MKSLIISFFAHPAKQRMNQINRFLFLVFPAILFTACESGKSIQRRMLYIQSELFYELTTPVYSENIDNTVYLNPICDMSILPYTKVQRKGGKFIPLIFFNYGECKYKTELGNASLIQPYYEFLTDALMAECNRSSCFNLKINDDIVLPDSAMILEVKINKNITSTSMIYKRILLIIPNSDGDSSFASSYWEIEKPVSSLEISVCLMQNDSCLWKKTYTRTQDFPRKEKGIEDPLYVYKICIENMTENLSYTTKDVVEDISRNLHLLMLAR